MSLVEEPYYEKRDCSPMCNHQEECVRCHSPHCIKYMYHSRLHGYTCSCGSQEWKPVFGFSNSVKRANKGLQADEAVCSAKYHLLLAEKGDTVCGVCGSPLRR